MAQLPDEVVGLVLSYLDPPDVARMQLASHRFLGLARDNELWKQICFEHSRAEARRRRNQLLEAQEATLAALTRAVNGLADDNPFANTRLARQPHDSLEHPTALTQRPSQENARARAFVSWDPSRPGERIDFYQEYLHRHCPISLDWVQQAHDRSAPTSLEAVGMGLLKGPDSDAERIIAPLEDGSVAIWELSADVPASKRGRIIERSPPGLLAAQQDGKGTGSMPAMIMNEPGAIENVSIDRGGLRAYFAVQDTLNEVDLTTLKVARREHFPFAITALSEATAPSPLTVGTSMTLHLYDTRDHRPVMTAANFSPTLTRTEQISGPAPISSSHALLSQPGPLSILHHPQDIWVAGRFTSLLCYDRRFWPRINRTVFSGARLSSLLSLPFAHVPHDRELSRADHVSLSEYNAAKSAPGTTLVAAGEYRGKGSVELYGLSGQRDAGRDKGPAVTSSYANRQTASRSRLLSVAAHGARLVFSDGDGGLKWVERDGSSLVRTANINDDTLAGRHGRDALASDDAASVDSGYGSASATEARGAPALFRTGENSTGDIVQKITPVRGNGAVHDDGGYRTANRDDLLVWTGDGRIGLLGFRRHSAFDGLDDETGADAAGEAGEKERLYEMRMRRALERQADETRFVQGLGLPQMGW